MQVGCVERDHGWTCPGSCSPSSLTALLGQTHQDCSPLLKESLPAPQTPGMSGGPGSPANLARFPPYAHCPSYAMPLMVPGSGQGLGARPGFPPPPFQDVCLAGRRGILQPVPHQLRAKSQTGSLVELVTPGSSWGPQRGVLPWRQGC